MLSCIVTTAQEPATIGSALQALIDQRWPTEYELLVACPDDATASVVSDYQLRHSRVRLLRDRGEGKPAALNMAIAEARGSICVFTDGDVRVEPGAIAALLAPLADARCGAVSGRPVSANARSTMLGYWSHLLADAGADHVRQRCARLGRYFDCSGYLFAARRALLPQLPSHTLADDAYISQCIWGLGHRLAYAPDARVAVRYPTNYADWLLQKRRSAAGATIAGRHDMFVQARRVTQPMRSFPREVALGLQSMLRYPVGTREYWWMACLFAARLHLWSLVWVELRLRRRRHTDVWRRVESTK